MSYQSALNQAKKQIDDAIKGSASSRVILLNRISNKKWQYMDQVFTEEQLLEEFNTELTGRIIVMMDFGHPDKEFKPSKLHHL